MAQAQKPAPSAALSDPTVSPSRPRKSITSRLGRFNPFRPLFARASRTFKGLTRKFGRIYKNVRNFSIIPRTVVTLSIQDDMAQAAVIRGSRITRWHSIRLGEGRSSNGNGTSFHGEFTGAELKALLLQVGKKRGPVVVDLPFHSTLARYMPAPKVRHQFVQQVVRSQTLGSIPFKPEHVDVPWMIVNDAGKSHALSMAVSKRAMAQQVELVRSAGFYVQSSYSKITALVSLCPEKTALTAYLTPRSGIFVLVVDGAPRITHETAFDYGEKAAHSLAAQAATAVQQVFAYHQTIDLESKLIDAPLYVAGPIIADASAMKELHHLSGRLVSPLSVPLKTRPEFPINDFVFNCGLAISHKNRSRSGARTRAGSALDLLPEYQKHQIIPAGALTSFGLLLVAASFVPQLQGLNDTIKADTVQLQARVVRLESEERRSRLETGRIQRLESEIGTTNQQIQTLESYLDTLSLGLINHMDQLDAIVYLAGPASVDIVNVVESASGFNIDGSAPGYDELNAYISAVLESGYINSVKIRNVGTEDAEGDGLIQASTSRVTFQILAETDTVPEQES